MLASEAATSRASASSSSMHWLRLMMAARQASSRVGRRARRRGQAQAWAMRSSSSLASNGLVR
jgi:hypothetical protein